MDWVDFFVCRRRQVNLIKYFVHCFSNSQYFYCIFIYFRIKKTGCMWYHKMWSKIQWSLCYITYMYLRHLKCKERSIDSTERNQRVWFKSEVILSFWRKKESRLQKFVTWLSVNAQRVLGTTLQKVVTLRTSFRPPLRQGGLSRALKI